MLLAALILLQCLVSWSLHSRYQFNRIDLPDRVNGKKILVLGGTGFVGNKFIKEASKLGYDIVSISRRGRRVDESENNRIEWLSGIV